MRAVEKTLATKYIIFSTILLVIIDQITKTIVQLTQCETKFLAGFGLKYVENRGLAFGWLSQTGYGSYIGLIIHIVFIFIICFYYYRYFFNKKDISWRAIFGFTLVVTGAVAAIIDRALFGFGRDFIVIPRYAVVNFGDIFLVFGAILICIELFRNNRFTKTSKILNSNSGDIYL